jgi:hypothetical protein
MNAPQLPALGPFDGCSFCDTPPPDDGNHSGWTARQLGQDITRHVSDDTPPITTPAAIYALCPACETLIATRDVASLTDDEMRMVIAAGLPKRFHDAARSELAAHNLAIINAIGDPTPLADLLAT